MFINTTTHVTKTIIKKPLKHNMQSYMKTVDVDLTESGTLLNKIYNGNAFYNRVGSVVRIHRVTYTVYITTSSASTSSYAQVSLVYDKFGNNDGIGPTDTYQPLSFTNNSGTTTYNQLLSFPTTITPDRYIFICTDRGPVSTNPPYVLTRDIQVDLLTSYKTIGPLSNITTGALYLDIRTGGSAYGTARVYFTDAT